MMNALMLPPLASEWLNLLLRWIHVLAAIMWIGDSLLFMWMDSSLSPPSRPRAGAVAGELWMVHSGGFYEVVKRRSLAPGEMPATLYWFKWQAYTTWITGLLLFVVVYYIGAGAYLVDPAVSRLGHGGGVAVSLGLMAASWIAYDRLWASPIGARPRVAVAISLALLAVAGWACVTLFASRAAYLQFGAMMGTVMAANVRFRIIPAQDQMLAATRAGTAVDLSLGVRAKTRSIHNHYLTLPVLFTMLSQHFPGTYGGRFALASLLLLVAFGMALKYVMNERGKSSRWVMAGGAAALIAAIGLAANSERAPAADPSLGNGREVRFTEVEAILQRRCVNCHASHPANPAFPQPPNGIILEDPRRVRALAPRILVRAVTTRTMPLGNLTGMTDEERLTLGAWIAQGARIDAGPR